MFSTFDTPANRRLKVAVLSQLVLLAATLLTALVWGQHQALVFAAIWVPVWALMGLAGCFFGHLKERRRKEDHTERLRRRAALYGRKDT